MRVLQAYSGNPVDFHLILDMLPSLARLYLSGQLPATPQLWTGTGRCMTVLPAHALRVMQQGVAVILACRQHMLCQIPQVAACGIWHSMCCLQATAATVSAPSIQAASTMKPTSTSIIAGLHVSFSLQAAILLTLGLQQREVSDLQAELRLPSNQVLALFNKAIHKLHGHLGAVQRPLSQWPPGHLATPCQDRCCVRLLLSATEYGTATCTVRYSTGTVRYCKLEWR